MAYHGPYLHKPKWRLLQSSTTLVNQPSSLLCLTRNIGSRFFPKKRHERGAYVGLITSGAPSILFVMSQGGLLTRESGHAIRPVGPLPGVVEIWGVVSRTSLSILPINLSAVSGFLACTWIGIPSIKAFVAPYTLCSSA